MINLYNRDCLEAMKEMDTNYYSLAIVDPPFGIGNFVQQRGKFRDGGSRKEKKAVDWNKYIPTDEYFAELRRVSKHRIIFGANYFNCFEGKMGAIIWVKNQPMPDFSKAVIASCSIHQKVEIYEQKWTNFEARGRCTKHPCEMPVGLYLWLLQTYAKEGDKILDTHLGSGSIAVAAHTLKVDLDAFEISETYFEEAKNRLRRHQQQLTLF